MWNLTAWRCLELDAEVLRNSAFSENPGWQCRFCFIFLWILFCLQTAAAGEVELRGFTVPREPCKGDRGAYGGLDPLSPPCLCPPSPRGLVEPLVWEGFTALVAVVQVEWRMVGCRGLVALTWIRRHKKSAGLGDRSVWETRGASGCRK